MKKLHPLINRIDSPHYDHEDGKPSSIEKMEEGISIREMIGAMSYNIFKVNWRLGKKDPEEKEARKLATYVAYQNALYDLLGAGVDETLSVHNAWKITEKEWRYT